MSDDLRARIAAVLTGHLTDEAQYRCWCGLVTGGDEGYTRHVADAVIREVLTPEFLADLVIEAIQKAADDDQT